MADLSPRQWGKGDPEPPVDVKLTDSEGFPVECRDSLWHVADSEDGYPWTDLDDEFDVAWPLTEVPPETATVLCSFCDNSVEAVPSYPKYAMRHRVNLSDAESEWCPGSWKDANGAPPPEDAPIPVSLVSGGQGSGETPTTEALKADSWPLADPKTELVKTIREWLPGDAAVDLADALLNEGWRPPQTTLRAKELEVDGEAGAWYVRILDEDVHHTTEGAPVNIDWTRDGTMIGVEILGSADQVAGASNLADQGVRAPSTQDETEWGTEDRDGSIRIAEDESEARWIVTKAEPSWKLKQRRVSPWVSVSSVEGDKP